jgi:MFS family permease
MGVVVVALVIFGLTQGFSYGPQAALYAELFPARIRLTGASISYAIGAILGGAFAPTIAAWLEGVFGSTLAVSAYLFVVVLLSLLATLTIKDCTGADLSPQPGTPGTEADSTDVGRLRTPN